MNGLIYLMTTQNFFYINNNTVYYNIIRTETGMVYLKQRNYLLAITLFIELEHGE